MKFFNKNLLKIIIPTFVLIFLLLPQITNAGLFDSISSYANSLIDRYDDRQYDKSGIGKINNGLDITKNSAGITDSQTSSLPTMLGRVINYSFGIIGSIFMLMTILGGFFWMTAGGNDEKVGKAKGFIMNGINGIIVIFLAYTLVYVVLAALGNVG